MRFRLALYTAILSIFVVVVSTTAFAQATAPVATPEPTLKVDPGPTDDEILAQEHERLRAVLKYSKFNRRLVSWVTKPHNVQAPCDAFLKGKVWTEARKANKKKAVLDLDCLMAPEATDSLSTGNFEMSVFKSVATARGAKIKTKEDLELRHQALKLYGPVLQNAKGRPLGGSSLVHEDLAEFRRIKAEFWQAIRTRYKKTFAWAYKAHSAQFGCTSSSGGKHPMDLTCFRRGMEAYEPAIAMRRFESFLEARDAKKADSLGQQMFYIAVLYAFGDQMSRGPAGQRLID